MKNEALPATVEKYKITNKINILQGGCARQCYLIYGPK
jgi:hypothetical protein